MIQEVYKSRKYSPELVTGRYIRIHGEQFKVFETETCWSTGQFYGKLGMGCTIREYITSGEEIHPETLKMVKEANHCHMIRID